MAWITPVTDRTSGAICTAIDMNRIAGNLDWLTTELSTHQLYSGTTISKTSYNADDYVTIGDWSNILDVLNDLIDAILPDIGQAADDSTTYTNFNAVESITLAIYDRYQLILNQANANHYVGDSIYTEGEISGYVGGLAI